VIDLTHLFHRIKHKIQRLVFGEVLQALLTKFLLGRALFGADECPRQNQGILDQVKGLQANIDAAKYNQSRGEEASDHEPQTVSSEYMRDSQSEDHKSSGKEYWSTKYEMFARAFDAYVSDKLADNAAKNTYLANNLGIMPKGAERAKINNAFDVLVGNIKVKDTEHGPVLFFRNKVPSGETAHHNEIDKGTMLHSRSKTHRRSSMVDMPDNLTNALTQTSLSALKGKEGSLARAEYNAAKKGGDDRAAINVVSRVVKDDKIEAIRKTLDPDKPIYVVPVIHPEGANINRLPMAYARELAVRLGGKVYPGIVRSDGNANTGATQEDRLMNEITFNGEPLDPNGQYIIADDNYTSGGTVIALYDHLTRQGVDVRAITTMASSRYGAGIKPRAGRIQAMLDSAGLTEKEASSIIGHAVGGLTDAELNIITRSLGKQGSPKIRRIFAERSLASFRKHESDLQGTGQARSPNRLTNPHTTESLTKALPEAFDGRLDKDSKQAVQAMLDAGQARVITTQQAADIVGDDALFMVAYHGSPHDHNKL